MVPVMLTVQKSQAGDANMKNTVCEMFLSFPKESLYYIDMLAEVEINLQQHIYISCFIQKNQDTA